VFLSVLVLLIYRHFGLMAMGTSEGVQRSGLAIGKTAPEIQGVLGSGVETTLFPGNDGPSLLLFASPGCEPCEEVMPSVVLLAERLGDLHVTVTIPGREEDASSFEETYGSGLHVLAEDGSGAFERYAARVTPFAFVVGEDRLIRSKGLAANPQMLLSLFRSAGVLDQQVEAVLSEKLAETNGESLSRVAAVKEELAR
jgi:thiol-disulfide isomerase/thioredoxin